MKHTTCVSIGQDTPQKMSIFLKKALKVSEYAELRLDYLEPEDVPDALTLCKKYLNRCICTLRPVSEGGKFSGSERERISILKLIGEFQPFLVDVEFNTLKKSNGLHKYLKDSGNILVSWHDFKKTPPLSSLISRLNNMKKYSKFIKIVTTARTEYDTPKILCLYSKASKLKLVSFCMGEIGKISRIICLYMGAPFTYVSLGEAIAPGQYSIKEIKKLDSPLC